ncbi:MAG: amidohydrolase [Spirochaetaceae bacterium]|nr:amidohydrolase [Myxococcales bacterium]MCB9726319.1 amidohydrolase [Spirochaetaceae bacterium]HPG28609.1 amidohydrolase family protein [Myxococcota bacterium]
MPPAPSRTHLSIIDVDAHITEPHDLWSSRAPKTLKDRLPRVVETPEGRRWIVDRDVEISTGNPSSVVARNGSKSRGTEFFGWQIEDVHEASWDMRARVALLDELGLYAQILYPNVAGFGSQNFMKVKDDDLRRACAQIYNDAMAEIQAESGGRLLPMALMPWWNIEQSVAEVERAASLGLKGIVMCSDPDSIGLPDLGDDAWKPFWDACNDAELPINFHIGASETSFNMFGRAAWPSMGLRQRLALGSAALFVENSRVVSNMLYSGIFDRCPKLKIVSVESGIGWIPFVLESIDYEWSETGSQQERPLERKPSEYFRDHVFGCFWFEKTAPTKLIDKVGEDNVLFETDFPHPTCLYPDVQGYLDEVTQDWSETRTRKILQDNAAKLYKIDLPA